MLKRLSFQFKEVEAGETWEIRMMSGKGHSRLE